MGTAWSEWDRSIARTDCAIFHRKMGCQKRRERSVSGNEEHPVFTDHYAKELMTAEEYTAVQNYILGGAQFFEPEIDRAEQIL